MLIIFWAFTFSSLDVSQGGANFLNYKIYQNTFFAQFIGNIPSFD